jgi:pantothenate kinase
MTPTLDDAFKLARSAGRRIVLGLVGPPGAGKSTLAKAIVEYACEKVGDEWASCVPLDGFLLSNAQLQRLGRAHRKGAQDTYDLDGYARALQRIRECCGDVYVPEYDMSFHEAVAARGVVVQSAQLVVTEGNYLALNVPEWVSLRSYIDHIWYVDAPDAVREGRLLARWMAGGRDERAARLWFEKNDRPNSAVVKPSEIYCSRTIMSGVS